MRLLLMADSSVGNAIAEWLIKNYPADIGLVVTLSQNSIFLAAFDKGIPSIVFDTEQQLQTVLSTIAPFKLGLLAWWPKLISQEVIDKTEYGFINTHPSLLPNNRGKHYNFWALVEQSPFGVSIHFIDKGIDSGDIIAQCVIPYDWEDTGASLYAKAELAMLELFKKTYPEIRKGEINRFPQDLNKGSLHFSSELDNASIVELDEFYKARDLINLLRARTFPGHPACRFEENGQTFEITVNIKRKII